MNLQKLIEQTQIVIDDPDVTPSELTNMRAELTAIIGDISDEQQMFVEALADAADSKGQHNKEHCKKVAKTSREIAKYLELNEKTNDLIYYAGLLQNIGKIALSEELFTKKEKLTAEEWQKLRNHPNVGVSLLMNINFLSEIIPYVHYHKERWDGQGEPEGLKGRSIPFGSRIIAVADAYQALISKRPYREPLSPNEAIEILKKEAEVKWDPIIVDAIDHLYGE
jgi:HD-GYP domain-containing protein (c-di-GMP phosphodiesterase class II)